MKKQTLPIFLWLVIPVLMIIGQIVMENTIDDKVLLARLHSEGGPQETLQEYFIAAALLMGIYSLVKIDWSAQKLVGIVVAIATFGCVYILGEEISWGQHKFGWSTPEFFAAINDQQETNLHNTSHWLDQKPRLLLFIGIVIGGLIVPAMARWKPEKLPAKSRELYPSCTLCVTAAAVLLVYVIEEIFEHIMGHRLFTRMSEVQEAYMYYFIFLYLLDLYKREISKFNADKK
ncbi:MAG: hypothetical protein DI626_10235 [Micavibrio aeruginosavorus]|uniref:Uncharacterized protein n=1 Tax=Micavibrio aeruginosavorus TaxID=349221 RepID=A0A2W5BGU2_9BACT|nr:MAG: hypothetical protein DI626_10235 [Micavibrio aeruginosavorus]